jgi:hypothetical protein
MTERSVDQGQGHLLVESVMLVMFTFLKSRSKLR